MFLYFLSTPALAIAMVSLQSLFIHLIGKASVSRYFTNRHKQREGYRNPPSSIIYRDIFSAYGSTAQITHNSDKSESNLDSLFFIMQTFYFQASHNHMAYHRTVNS